METERASRPPIDPDRRKALLLGFGTGFLVGLPVAAVVASFIAWGSLIKRQKDLALDWSPAEAIVVTTELRAGDALRESGLAARAVPKSIVSPNTVVPGDEKELAGRRTAIDLQPGDVLLRSAIGLPPRP